MCMRPCILVLHVCIYNIKQGFLIIKTKKWETKGSSSSPDSIMTRQQTLTLFNLLLFYHCLCLLWELQNIALMAFIHRLMLYTKPKYCPNQNCPSAFLMKACFLSNLYSFSTTSTWYLSLSWSDLYCALCHSPSGVLSSSCWRFLYDLWRSIYGPYQPHTHASAILNCPVPW